MLQQHHMCGRMRKVDIVLMISRLGDTHQNQYHQQQQAEITRLVKAFHCMCVKQCSPCDFPETVATLKRTQTLHATSGAQPNHSTASRLIALIQALSNRRRQPHCFSSLRLTYTQSICDGSKTFHSIAIHNTCQSPAANHCTQDSQTWHNDVILVTLHEVGGKAAPKHNLQCNCWTQHQAGQTPTRAKNCRWCCLGEEFHLISSNMSRSLSTQLPKLSAVHQPKNENNNTRTSHRNAHNNQKQPSVMNLHYNWSACTHR